MKKTAIIVSVLGLLGFFLPGALAASLKLLLENSRLYDQQEIEMTVEVLDQLPQETGSWFNVSDDTASIGVWVDKGLRLPDIVHLGSFNVKGDIIIVKGVFHASCDKHLGQMDIHARQITLMARGMAVKERVASGKKRLALGWFVFFLIILVIYSVRRFLRRSGSRPDRVQHA